jgi:hypothetical protein
MREKLAKGLPAVQPRQARRGKEARSEDRSKPRREVNAGQRQK